MNTLNYGDNVNSWGELLWRLLLFHILVLVVAIPCVFAQTELEPEDYDRSVLEAMGLILKASKRGDAKDWDGAIGYVNQAIFLERDHPALMADSYAMRAWLWVEKRNFRRALADSARAMRLNPAQSFRYYADRAQMRVKFRDLDRALADAEKSLELKPDNSSSVLIRGAVHSARKEYDLAIADYNRSMELNAAQKDPQGALKMRAEVYRAQGKIDLAEADEKIYNEGILKNAAMMIAALPDQASVYYRLRGEYRSDIRLWHTALGELPTRMKEYDKAIEDFTSALKINPKDRRALKDRAEVYRILGKIDLAKADEKAYRATEPRSSRSKKH